MPPEPPNHHLADEELPTDPEVRSFARPWLLAIIWIVGAYVLSPAPVIWGLQKVGGSSASAKSDLVYAPIVVLYRKVPFIRAFYDWQFKALGIRP